jgi:formylglycine-generating enzyme required for sulfatase activity
MAQSGESGVTTYAGITIILLIAVGALVLFKFNLFNIQGLFSGDGDDHSRIPIEPPLEGGDAGDPIDPGTQGPGPMPDAAKYRVNRESPLPLKLTLPRHVGNYKTEIEMRLVPQGWFPMGENDGVRSNMPKRWVWMDDFYIATTEITNEQMYAFILADGYRDAALWSPEGIKYVRDQVPTRGTPYIGWTPLERGLRMWALSSPQGEVTLQADDKEKVAPVKNMQLLVLPANGEWSSFFDVGEGSTRIKERDAWHDINGEGISKEEKLKPWMYTTDMQGRLHLNNLVSRQDYIVLAWPDGLTEPALFGKFYRGSSSGLGGAKMPAVGMSWFEADACCRFFGGLLPSEAQWEKAGRGAQGRLFPWGNELDMTQEVPIGGGNSRKTTPHANLNLRRVMEVGSYNLGASEYGVQDLVGNVSEWCRDVYIEVPVWSERNPVNAGGAKERRAERGSSTEDDDPQIVKLHNRRSSDPYKRQVDTRGFRLAMDAETALKLADWK